MQVRPAKTQISLHKRTVWSRSLHGTLWVAKEPKRLQSADAKVDLSLRWAHIQSCRECCAPALFIYQPVRLGWRCFICQNMDINYMYFQWPRIEYSMLKRVNYFWCLFNTIYWSNIIQKVYALTMKGLHWENIGLCLSLPYYWKQSLFLTSAMFKNMLSTGTTNIEGGM